MLVARDTTPRRRISLKAGGPFQKTQNYFRDKRDSGIRPGRLLACFWRAPKALDRPGFTRPMALRANCRFRWLISRDSTHWLSNYWLLFLGTLGELIGFREIDALNPIGLLLDSGEYLKKSEHKRYLKLIMCGFAL